MFRGYLVGRLYPRDTRENQLSPSVMTLSIPVMCRAHASFHRKASQELPAKLLALHFTLNLQNSLSHTTLTKKSHIKYRVHKIEQNYN